LARLLVLDVGNETTGVGIFDGDSLAASWRLASEVHRTADDYGLLLRQAMRDVREPCAGAVLGSVLPALTRILCRACLDYLDLDPLVVGPGVRSGIRIRTENPRELGADRVANAVSAVRRHGVPAIVVDFGTATTFDVIGSEGDYLGTVITPGLGLAAQALAREAAQLQVVELSRPRSVVGRSTVAAVQSGLVHGWAGLVEGIVSRVRAEVGHPCRVLATGPLAELVGSATDVIERVDPDLTLHGLRLIWEMNRA
jgi:type III pantothenate kinase